MGKRTGLVVALGVLVLVSVVAAAPGKLPSSLKTCKQADPDFNDCIKTAIQNGIPTLVKGIPSLGSPPIDPLEVTSLSIGEEKGKPVSINLDFNNIFIGGIRNVIIDKVEMVPGDTEMKIKVHIPGLVSITGPYKVDGKVLVLPIQGQGNCNITLSNLDADILIKGEKMDKDGATYMNVKDFQFKFTTDRLYLFLENLFNGDKGLGDNMNTFLNENWQDILKELQPPIEEALGLSFKEISNRFFHKVKYDDIFPPK